MAQVLPSVQPQPKGKEKPCTGESAAVLSLFFG